MMLPISPTQDRLLSGLGPAYLMCDDRPDTPYFRIDLWNLILGNDQK